MATTWTEGRRKQYIITVLRNGTRRYPPKYNVLNAAKTKKKKNKLSGRIAQHYKCNACNKDFPLTSVQVDHVVPVVGPEGFTNWDDYIIRLYCAEENLQVLCKPCHNIKTQGETKYKSIRQSKLKKEQ